MTAIVFSEGILKIPHLEQLVEEEVVGPSKAKQGADRVFGWGMKHNTARARQYAIENDIPFVALEDGFLRSYGLGANGVPPLSIVMDSSGIYYDATQPSDMELILNSDALLPGNLIEDAQRAMELVVTNGITKYCSSKPFNPALFGAERASGRRVMLIDQTYGDMSVLLGGGTPEVFEDMIRAAIVENPGAQIWIKSHPDVLAGKKRGYLVELAEKYELPVLAEDFNPYTMFPYFEKIYTVTSQMGFEALLAGKKVVCFGVPFYSGWGCTDDRMVCARRTKLRGILEIFAVAYLLYPRYLNPLTKEAGTIFDVIDYLCRMQARERALSGKVFVLGVRRWKRSLILPFLKTQGNQVYFVGDAAQAVKLGISAGDKVVTWGYENFMAAQAMAEERHCRVIVMEDGFIRSVGLGSNFVAPYSLVVDLSEGGCYYNSNCLSGLESLMLDDENFPPAMLQRAANLREEIVRLGITKYNVDAVTPVKLGSRPEQRVIFVPGQVETDSSIRMAADEVKTNIDLLRAVRKANPEAFIVFKPHPDVVAGNRIGGVTRQELLKCCDEIEVAASSIALINAADEVHVMTSQVGFDALLRGKKVVCYGAPFYAGYGLTEDKCEPRRLSRREALLGRRTLDHLVAAALIMYPTYIDPETGGLCEPEFVVQQLDQKRRANPATAPSAEGFASRICRQARRFAHFIRGVPA